MVALALTVLAVPVVVVDVLPSGAQVEPVAAPVGRPLLADLAGTVVSLETTTTVVPEPVEVPVTEPEVTTSTTVAPPTTTTMAPTTTTTQAPTTTTTTPPPPPPPAPPGAPSDGYWDRMAMCETGGNWAHYPNGTYTGGLGIYNGTWLTWGGGEFAPRAGLATREQQIAVANRIAITGHNGVSPVGLSAWGCTAKIGFP
jgi:resuscitation-promoting factor RpfB